METNEWKWKSSYGLEMYSKAWTPAGKAKGVVCLLHGGGEHIGRYQVDGEALAAKGYILAGFDLRGFGKSQGRRGQTPSLEAYFDDIDRFLEEVARCYPGLPRFLYGHSMGSLILLAYTPLRQPDVTGVIAASPTLKTYLHEQKLKVFLAKTLGKLLPTFTMDTGLDTQVIHRDPRVIEENKNDPLLHTLITAALGLAMLEASDLAIKNAPHFPLPLLLMHGTEDGVAYPSGSQNFATLVPKDKVTLKMWDGFLHELHTDPEKAQVFKFMIEWLDKHLP
jgi:alpha-beta hydrolase superfamily lysophospholipase